MKVIKAPEDIKTWRDECTCPRCNAVLEYEVSDIKYTPGGGDMRDSWPATYMIACAVCKQNISIDDSKLSEYVKHTVRNNSTNTSLLYR